MAKDAIEKLLGQTAKAGLSAKTDDFSKAIEAMESKLKAVKKKELAKGNGPNNKAPTKGVDINNNTQAKPVNVQANKQQPKTSKVASGQQVKPAAATAKKPAAAQSPKKGKKGKNSDVPSVQEMVLEAIKSLGEKKGSLSKPIKDHIVEIYKDTVDEKKLPTTYQVNKALTTAVEENLVIQNKSRFQLVAKEAGKEDSKKNAKSGQAKEKTGVKRKGAEIEKGAEQPKSKNQKKAQETAKKNENNDSSSSDQPELPDGWKREIVARKSTTDGTSSGKASDVYIYDPSGKKFRSKPQLTKYFEENPDKQIPQEDLDCILKAFKRNIGDEVKAPKTKATKSEKSNNDTVKSSKPAKQIPMTPKQEMIINAVKALATKKGTDKKSIRKYIEENHKDVTNLKFVHKELQTCVKKGLLVPNRRFFKLPGDGPSTPAKQRGPYKKKDKAQKTKDAVTAKENSGSENDENASENEENASGNDDNGSENEDNESESGEKITGDNENEEEEGETEENASENEEDAPENEENGSEKEEDGSENEEEGSENENNGSEAEEDENEENE